MRVLTEVLDGCITGLRTHGTLKTTYLLQGQLVMSSELAFDRTYSEPSLLQPVRDEVQEVDELSEDNALSRRILLPEVAEFLYESLDLRRGTPLVQVKTTEDALADLHVLILQLERRCL